MNTCALCSRVAELEALHGMDVCGECYDEHDASCCERCARVGLCPVHVFATNPECEYACS